MKTKITFLKVSLVALFLFISNAAWSATYYTCINTGLNLTATAAPGTTLLWDVHKDGAVGSVSGYPSATAPASFADAGSYVVTLVNRTDAASGTCPSDPIDNTIIVMPALAFGLGTPSLAVYCAANTTTNTSTAAATVTNTQADAITANFLALNFTYTATKDNVAVPIAQVGTVATDGTFTFNTIIPGTYIITGSVKYVQGTVTTNPLLGNGCPVSASSTQQVIVTDKPAQPTIITITAAP
ncbi:MAG TPA: hypothetical protein VK541_09920 [Pedobacter sp.]|uniref:hypothetical protein n=1 Tax=Pedobacter sp. TaxID=1411316 RepID=UPI002C53EA7D|nr:hypothetical protein [Pedobacter sp.]HMI02788.1 hypothetical protein [Pedobacter sp.]